MQTALIGYTGFVGSNLRESHQFTDVFNTKNINDLRGRKYDLLVSAGNRADSFRINAHGADDLAEVDQLIDTIETAEIKKLVLISTVCVYPEGGSPDEDTPLSERGLTPYGANRLHQERRLAERFDTTIIRLPQLYGSNLKKGVVYDLMNNYRVEHIRPAARFQHYDVRRLWNDIQTALAAGLSSLNVSTPALSNNELAAEVFGRDISSQTPAGEESAFSKMYTRDMRTKHSSLYGGDDGYLASKQAVIDGLRSFVSGEPNTGRE